MRRLFFVLVLVASAWLVEPIAKVGDCKVGAHECDQYATEPKSKAKCVVLKQPNEGITNVCVFYKVNAPSKGLNATEPPAPPPKVCMKGHKACTHQCRSLRNRVVDAGGYKACVVKVDAYECLDDRDISDLDGPWCGCALLEDATMVKEGMDFWNKCGMQ